MNVDGVVGELFGQRVVRFPAQHGNCSLVRRLKAGEQAKQRRFPRSVRPDERDAITGVQIKVQPIEYLVVSLTKRRIAVANVPEGDDRLTITVLCVLLA